jgi:hypothetical protein
MDGTRSTRCRLAGLGARALLALVIPGALAAQSAVDTAAAVGLQVTPTGALPTPASGTLAGATTTGFALSALYGYAHDRPARGLFTTSAGARLDLRLPGGFINLSASGGRRLASCPHTPRSPAETFLELECQDLWLAGVEATVRLVRADIVDRFSSATTCLTISLQGTAGVADADPDRLREDPHDAAARSATAGVVVALAAPMDRATVVPFFTPTLGWGRVNTRRIAPRVDAGAVVGADSIPFVQKGVRLGLGGGLAVLGTRSGVGLHLAVQGPAVRGGGVTVGAAVSVASPFGRRDRGSWEQDGWGSVRTSRAPSSMCNDLSGR